MASIGKDFVKKKKKRKKRNEFFLCKNSLLMKVKYFAPVLLILGHNAVKPPSVKNFKISK